MRPLPSASMELGFSGHQDLKEFLHFTWSKAEGRCYLGVLSIMLCHYGVLT